jgi:uncharacterized protein (TIGR03437 family)
MAGAGTVTSNQTAALTAAITGQTASTQVSLVANVTPSEVSCNPSSVNAQGSSSCTVTLSGAATGGGLAVALASSNANATVPANVTVAAGATSAGFTATVGSITRNQTAMITATANSVSKTFSLSLVTATWTISGTISPATIGQGATVSLNGASKAAVTADSSGTYTFKGLKKGTYTVSPSKRGVTFNLALQSVSVNGASVAGVDFVGVQSHQVKNAVVVSGLSQVQSVAQPQAAAAPAAGTSLTMASSATRMAGKTCSPGGLVTILGTAMTEQDSQSATSYPLPTQLAGLQVQVNGEALPLLYASPSQINFQCPLLPAGSPLDISVVAQNGVPVAAAQGTMVAAAPDLFTLNGTNQGVVLITSTNQIAMPKTNGMASSPAQPGDLLSIYPSGLGETQDLVPAGTAAPSTPPIQLKNQIGVFIGGIEVEPGLAILAPGTAGLYQVNVQLPANVAIGSAVPLYLQVKFPDGTVVRSNTVTLAIDPAGH